MNRPLTQNPGAASMMRNLLLLSETKPKQIARSADGSERKIY
jgi:hypothetical protein